VKKADRRMGNVPVTRLARATANGRVMEIDPARKVGRVMEIGRVLKGMVLVRRRLLRRVAKGIVLVKRPVLATEIAHVRKGMSDVRARRHAMGIAPVKRIALVMASVRVKQDDLAMRGVRKGLSVVRSRREKVIVRLDRLAPKGTCAGLVLPEKPIDPMARSRHASPTGDRKPMAVVPRDRPAAAMKNCIAPCRICVDSLKNCAVKWAPFERKSVVGSSDAGSVYASMQHGPWRALSRGRVVDAGGP